MAKDALHWKMMFDLISVCSREHTPKGLAVSILEHIGDFCPFDQGFVYFFDGNGRVCDQYLKNISDRCSVLYLDYYIHADESKYSCYKEYREAQSHPLLKIHDWEKEDSLDFVPNFIRPRGLKYSASFVLYDLNGNYRTVFSLDRTRPAPFQEQELESLRSLIPVFNGIHKNFYYEEFNQTELRMKLWQNVRLTEREIQVANLLCQGVSPANISRTLYIAPKTTYQHISNIYKKLHVSSRQELLVLLLRQ